MLRTYQIVIFIHSIMNDDDAMKMIRHDRKIPQLDSLKMFG